jgi:hypothetical protein
VHVDAVVCLVIDIQVAVDKRLSIVNGGKDTNGAAPEKIGDPTLVIYSAV